LENEYVMGVDTGTTMVKVYVFDKNGRVMGSGDAPHGESHPQPAWYEQDPEDWWSKFCKACKESLAKSKVPKDKIAAFGISHQRATMLPLDKDGNALYPAIVWMDTRRVEEAKESRKNVDPEKFLHMTTIPFAWYGPENSKELWFKYKRPDIYKKTYKFVGVQPWFVHRLTGEWKDTSASVGAGFLMVDQSKHRWSDYLIDAFGVDREKLCDLYPPTTVLGHVTKKAAEETGLPEGLPVVAGAGDKQCEVLGAGCIKSDMLGASLGTAATFGTTVYEYDKAWKPGVSVSRPSPVPGAWNPETGIGAGFWMVKWFRDEFCDKEKEFAKERGVWPEKVMDEDLAAKAPAGSLGLIVQPYWWGKSGDPGARGSVLGWKLWHRKSHFYRATLEGVAYEARLGKEFIENALGVKFSDVRACAGGSKSNVACQIIADVLNAPVSTVQTSDTGTLGAAIDAAVGTGLYRSVQEAVENMVHVTSKFEPKPQNVKVYDRIFNEVYLKVYPQIKDLSPIIADIIGAVGGV